jgi:hypothetical protein
MVHPIYTCFCAYTIQARKKQNPARNSKSSNVQNRPSGLSPFPQQSTLDSVDCLLLQACVIDSL